VKKEGLLQIRSPTLNGAISKALNFIQWQQRFMKKPSKTVWDEKFLPTGFCRISGTERAVQDYMEKTRQICLAAGSPTEAVNVNSHSKKKGYPKNV
jgi:hypothetical protein